MREIAKQNNLKGYSCMWKNQLHDLIELKASLRFVRKGKVKDKKDGARITALSGLSCSPIIRC